MSNDQKLALFNYIMNEEGYFVRTQESEFEHIARLTLGQVSQEEWDSAATFDICFVCKKFVSGECKETMDANLCGLYEPRVLLTGDIQTIKEKVTGK